MAWGNLPPDLVQAVIHILQKDDGLHKAVIVRMVCKSWLEAFTQYPGEGRCRGVNRLGEYCKLLPAMTGLDLYALGPAKVDLQPLHAYTQLSKLTLHGVEEIGIKPPYLQTDDLPDHISFLRLESIPLDCRGQHKQLTGLTTLVCMFMKPTDNSLCQLLQRTPNLKELVLMDSSDSRMKVEGLPCQGLSQLTHLNLAMQQFITPWLADSALQNLREINCLGLTTTDAWLNSLFRTAPQLTSVALGPGLSPRLDRQPLLVPTSVRGLAIDRMGPLMLPDLDLEKLSWTNTDPRGELLLDDVDYIGTLTSLTSLEFINIHDFEHIDLEPLEQLTGLRELRFNNCDAHFPGRLLRNASFQALEKLHVEDGYNNGLEDPSSSDDEGDREKTLQDDEDDSSNVYDFFERIRTVWMEESGKAVLSLPKLTQISGESSLVNLGMLKELKNWHVHDVKDGINMFGRGLKVWTKH